MKNLCVFTKEFLQEEDAVGVVEIILILVKSILGKIAKQSNSI